jgi:hypothetical protein
VGQGTASGGITRGKKKTAARDASAPFKWRSRDYPADTAGIRNVEPQKESVLSRGIYFDANSHAINPKKGRMAG